MCRICSFLSALKPTRLGVLFAVLVGLGVGFWQWGRPPRPRVVVQVADLRFFCFSPDGQTLLIEDCGDKDCLVTFWDVRTGQMRQKLHTLPQPGTIRFSPDGRNVAYFRARIEDDNSPGIRVLEVSSGKELAAYDQDDENGFPYRQLLFSSEGKLLVVTEKIDLWDVANKKLVAKLAPKGDFIGEGSNTLLVKSEPGIIKVWHLPSAKICAEIKGFEIPAYWGNKPNVVWPVLSADLRFLLLYCETRGGDGFQVRTAANDPVIVVDLISGKKHEITTTDFEKAHLAPDGKTVAIGVWPDSEEMSFWDRIMDWLGLQETPDGHYLVKLIDVSSEQDVANLIGYMSPTFSPDGKTLATANMKSLQLWDLPIRKPIGKILGLAGLAFMATLLASNGLAWSRRRAMKRRFQNSAIEPIQQVEVSMPAKNLD
jgi:WD40 repeat protein